MYPLSAICSTRTTEAQTSYTSLLLQRFQPKRIQKPTENVDKLRSPDASRSAHIVHILHKNRKPILSSFIKLTFGGIVKAKTTMKMKSTPTRTSDPMMTRDMVC